MMIFTDIKTVYLSNPKTGTTSFETAFKDKVDQDLSGLFSKHANFKVLRNKRPDIYRGYELITTVREPIETLNSWYRYRSRPSIAASENSTKSLTFAEFMEEWCKPEPAKFARVKTSIEFVLRRSGNVNRNIKLFKYGVKPDIIDYVNSKLEESVPKIFKNVSPTPAPSDEIQQVLNQFADHPKLKRIYDIWNDLEFENVG